MGTQLVFYSLLLVSLCGYSLCSDNSENVNNYTGGIGKSQTTPVKAVDPKQNNVVYNTSPVKPYQRNSSKSVELFNSYFQSEVKKCAKLTDLFDVARVVSREEIANAIFYLVTTFVALTGYKSPAENAFISQRYVTSIGDKPTPKLLLDVYSNAVSQFLDQEGFLYPENARNLAGRYALLMKEAADRNVKEDCPRSKLSAIIIGLNDFYVEQELFREVDIEDIAVLYGNLWLGRNGTGTPDSRQTTPKFYSKPPLLKTSDRLCNIKSRAIEQFTATFHDAVTKSKTLTDLLNIYFSLTPAEVSRGIFYVSLYFLQRRSVEDAAAKAEFMSRYARDICVLKPCVLERVHANSVAKILELQKVLTTKNAKSLAETFAAVLEASAKAIVDSRYPKSKIVAIRYGWRLFYKEIGGIVDMNEADTVLAYYYGNEWRCQSLSKKSD